VAITGKGYDQIAYKSPMNETTIKAAFSDWWRDSYGVPPGPHAVMTHVAFAAYLLTLLELMNDE
jgi:hypothetical protein